MLWNILDTGIQSAEENMRLDKELLDTLDPEGAPILHFYEWKKDSATYGYFVEPKDFLRVEGVEEVGLDLARRPTGGGIVFHLWDFAFSVLIPAGCPYFSSRPLDNYAFINEAVRRALSTFLQKPLELELIEEDGYAFDASCNRFCMAKPTKYDVVFSGKKIAGASQRKQKNGFLHQGTIALKRPCQDFLRKVLLPESAVAHAMELNTFALLSDTEDLKEGKKALAVLLEKQFTGN